MIFVTGFIVFLVFISLVYLFGLWIYNDVDNAVGMTVCMGVIGFTAYLAVSLILVLTEPVVL